MQNLEVEIRKEIEKLKNMIEKNEKIEEIKKQKIKLDTMLEEYFTKQKYNNTTYQNNSFIKAGKFGTINKKEKGEIDEKSKYHKNRTNITEIKKK